MEKELNIYGDVSWGEIFDDMDRFAHKYAISYIGDCVTATANIHYFRKPTIETDLVIESWMSEWNKCFVTVSMIEWSFKDAKIISTASFLFIKRK